MTDRFSSEILDRTTEHLQEHTDVAQLHKAFRWQLHEALLVSDKRTMISKRHKPREAREILARTKSIFADLDNTTIPEGSTDPLPPRLLRKIRTLRDAGTSTTFVTGKPWNEVERVIAELDNGDCPEFLMERGAFKLERQADGRMQIVDHLATPAMKAEAATLRDMFPAFREALKQQYAVGIEPAGQGGHQLVLSIDIVDPIRGNAKLSPLREDEAHILQEIFGDISHFLSIHFPLWTVADLGNGNFELTPKALTKRNAITPEHSLVIGDGGNDIEMFSLNERDDVHAAVVYHDLTPTQLTELADFGVGGKANAEAIFDQVIRAKGLLRQVWLNSNTPPFETKYDNSLGLRVGMPVALAKMVSQMDARNCRWIYLGDDDFEAHEHGLQGKLIPVPITPEERSRHYAKTSNETLWPVAHKPFVSTPVATPTQEDWGTYEQVCDKVAASIDSSLGRAVPGDTQPGRLVWVQDYQMIAVGHRLRERRPAEDYTLGFYWHIPFPDADSFIEGLGREQATKILTWFSQYHLVGFHTQRYEKNYQAACAQCDVPATRTLVKPISVNVEEIREMTADIAANGHVFERDDLNKIIDVAAIRANPNEAQKYVLCGVERCDDTKACVQRLEAWLLIAKDKPELLKGKTVIEVIVPSRQEIPYYKALYLEAKRLVQEINDTIGEPVIRHIDKIDSRKDVVAGMYYAGMFIVTPKADGFNMSAAEAAVVHAEKGDGTLMFSSRIGFADSLREHGLNDAAVFVDDVTPEGIAEGLVAALTGQARLTPERCAQLRAYFAIHDLQSWQQDNVRRCLEASCEAHIEMAV